MDQRGAYGRITAWRQLVTVYFKLPPRRWTTRAVIVWQLWRKWQCFDANAHGACYSSFEKHDKNGQCYLPVVVDNSFILTHLVKATEPIVYCSKIDQHFSMDDRAQNTKFSNITQTQVPGQIRFAFVSIAFTFLKPSSIYKNDFSRTGSVLTQYACPIERLNRLHCLHFTNDPVGSHASSYRLYDFSYMPAPAKTTRTTSAKRIPWQLR